LSSRAPGSEVGYYKINKRSQQISTQFRFQ
jgi:hypothetical protein